MTRPRLLVLSDVPVEASFHGSALIHRLLADYPPDRLCIVEAGFIASHPDRRLAHVEYHHRPHPFVRLAWTRLARLHGRATIAAAPLRALGYRALARRFGAEAVLTVSHGHSWLAAMRLARDLGLPLHLICHDEWRNTVALDGAWLDRLFDRRYAEATTRLCVSPYMVDDYRARTGARGTVLYPSRAPAAPRFAEPPARLAEPLAPLRIAFAGTLGSPGVGASLRALAAALDAVGGELHLFGPIDDAGIAAHRLDAANIRRRGTIANDAIIPTLRDAADALYVPMSFAEGERQAMRVAFPSKLTDCTATGLPILIHGPADCSAVRWAQEHDGVALVATDADPATLASLVATLAHDPARRLALGRAALAAGDACFSAEAASAVFDAALATRAPAHAVVALREHAA